MKNKQILRIIDANLNRAREGLRVCEDILRFCFDDKKLTSGFKSARHKLAVILKPHFIDRNDLLKNRRSADDIGRNLVVKKKYRPDVKELFYINIQRAQEALRVLEEASKISDPGLEAKFRKLRFKLYGLEKKISESVFKIK